MGDAWDADRPAAGLGTADDIALQVDELRRLHQTTAALDIARRGLLSCPVSPELLIARARVLLARYQFTEARETCERAAAAAPGDEAALAWQIACASRQRSFAEAESYGRHACAEIPHSALVRVALGRVYLDQYRYQQALDLFAEATTIDPGHAKALEWRMAALRALRRFAEAETAARTAIGHWPDRPDLLVELGRVYADQFDFEQALDSFSRALALDSRHFIAAIAHYKLGTLATDLRGSTGYRRRALKHLQHCLDRDPGNIEAQRAQQLLEPERAAARTAALGGVVIAGVALSLLSLLWTTFLLNTRVTVVMVTTITPILVGLVAVSVLLPSLVKLKLPGFEADLDSGPSRIPSGPTGDVALGPGKFTVAAGPTGQLARRA